MTYADLAAAKTALTNLITAVAAIETASVGTAELQKRNLMGPEQKTLAIPYRQTDIDAIQALLTAHLALFP